MRGRLLVGLLAVAGLMCAVVATHQTSNSGRGTVLRVVPGSALAKLSSRDVVSAKAMNGPVAQRASRRQLLRSRRAYRDLAASSAAALATRRFHISAHRGALSSGATSVVRRLGGSAAVVREGRRRALLVSTTPLAVTNSHGHSVPLSLRLKSRGRALVPEASPVALRVGQRAADGFRLGNSIHVKPVLTHRSRVGRVIGDGAFYSDVDTDTDLFVKATPSGAETFWQLRSPRSSRTQQLHFGLRAGAALRRSTSVPGGAEVTSGGRVVAIIPPATSRDADGAPVLTTMSTRGSALTVSVKLGRNVRYPVLVDPAVNGVVRENYGDYYNPANGAEASFPNFTQSGGAPFTFAKNSVLNVSGNTGVLGAVGGWQITAPGSAQIHRVDVDNAGFFNPTPKGAAFFAELTPNQNAAASAWTTNGNNGTSGGTLPLLLGQFGPVSLIFCAGHINGATDLATPGFCNPSAGVSGNHFRFGARTLTTFTGSTYIAQIGGASVSFVDPASPTAVATAGVPAGWVNSAPTVTVSGTQEGLGIGSFSLVNAAGATIASKDLNCYFDNSNPSTRRGKTTLTMPPCPGATGNQASGDLSTSGIPDGINTITGHAQSIVGADTAASASTLKLDRTKPTLVLSGALTQQDPAIPLSDPAYNLHVDASDGDSSIARSGVVSVTVSVTNASGPADTQTFTNPSCQPGNGGCLTTGMASDYTYTVSASKGGLHTVTVTAVDAAGNTFSAPTFSFSTLAPIALDTSLLGLEKYLQYDSTPTGPGSTAYVNLANGNFVWQDELLNNPGRGLNTFGALTYNDQQPLDANGKLTGEGLYNEVGQGFSVAISGITRLNEPLAITASNVTLTDADGTQHVFAADSAAPTSLLGLTALPTRYVAPPGVHLRLRRFNPSGIKTWAATRPDGVTYYFNAAGYATSIQDRNANSLLFGYQYALPALLPGPLQSIVSSLSCNAVSGVIEGITPLVQLLLVGLTVPLCTPQLATITDAGGRNVTVGYLPNGGHVDSITDHLGHITKFAYDSSSTFLTAVTGAFGTSDARSYRFGYSAPQGATTHTDLVAICDPLSPSSQGCGPGTPHTTAITYAAQRNLQTTAGAAVTKLTDRNGHATLYGYANAQVQHYAQAVVKDARAKSTTYTFDASSRPTAIVDALTRRTELGWDPANNLTSLTRAKGDPADEATTTYTYNQNGLLLTKTDPPTPDGLQHTKTLTYFDSQGTQLSSVAGGEDPAHPDDVSDLKSVTTPRGSVASGTYTTDFAYGTDGRGNLQTITEPLSRNALTGNQARGVVHATYDVFGQVTSQTDETANTTKYESYDANGLAQAKIDPRGSASEAQGHDRNVGRWLYRYDAGGNMLYATDPRGATSTDPGPGSNRVHARFTTSYGYDNLDRPRTAEVPRLSDDASLTVAQRFATRKWIYDSNDNVTTYADALGSVAIQGDAASAAADAASTAAYHATYDSMDLPRTQLTPAVAHPSDTGSAEVTELGYDEVDNLTSVKAPLARNAAGQPTGQAGAYTTTLGYDAANQKTSVVRQQVTSSATKQLVTSMAYDKRGNVVGVADPVHNATTACKTLGATQAAATASCQREKVVYDKADNLLHSIEDPAGLNLDSATSYFEDDAPKTMTDPRGNATTIAYDERGQKTTVTDPLSNTTTWQYDLAGRLSKLTKPNGNATATAGDFQTVYSYDPAGYLTDETVPRADGQYGSSSWAMHYVRDAVGDATSITDPRGHAFANTFFDTGELRSTARPSMYAFSAPRAPDGTPQPGQPAEQATTAGGPPEITQLSYDEVVKRASAPEAPLPQSPAQGSFGAVSPLPIPGVVPRAGATTFDYDLEMRLTSVKDAHPTLHTLGRDALGRITSITQPLHGADPATGTPADQITRAWTYDRDGNVAKFDSGDHDAQGVQAATTYGYDQFERLTSQAMPGSAGGTETSQYSYDDNDNPLTTTTAMGHATTLGYDAVDRLTSREDATHRLTSYGYDAAGNQTTNITPAGMAMPVAGRGPYTTTSQFNARNELSKVTDGLGNATTYGYDADGNQTSETAPGSQASPSGPTVSRQIDRTFDGRDLPWTQTTHDGLGQSTSNRTTITEYDANANLRRTVNPSAAAISGGIPTDDGESHLDMTSTANRDATVREYDAEGLLLYVNAPKGPASTSNDDHLFRTEFAYTNAGFIQTASLPRDVTGAVAPIVTSYLHEDNGWIKSATDPQHLSEAAGAGTQKLTYEYDHRGNQTKWVRDPGVSVPSRTIERTFAPNGVLINRNAKKGTVGERSYTYTYDADRRLLTSTTTIDSANPSRQGTHETFGYDDADRLLSANDSARATDTVMSYDPGGRVLTRQTDGTLSGGAYSGGKKTTFGYDSLDRQQTMSVNPGAGSGAIRNTSFDYWPSSDLKAMTDPNGVRHDSFYDASGQITDKRRSSGALPQTYSYDANGNRTRDEKGSESYNSRDQLVTWTRTGGAGTVAYVVNGAGAVVRSTDSNGPDTVNTLDGDRLTTATTTPQSGTPITRNYSYDGFGNLTRIHKTTDAATNDVTYTYDSFERMIGARDPSLTPAPTTAAYTYDGLDRRDTQVTGTNTTTYSYIASSTDLAVASSSDGSKQTFDYDANGSRLGQQVTAPLTTYRPYVTDAQGSVQGLEDTAGSITANQYRYDPYGNLDSVSTGEAQGNPFRFQGFQYDSTASAYNALAREYRPDIQRFLTQDRFEAAGADLNLATNALTSDRYAFVAGNPTSRTDTDGHDPNAIETDCVKSGAKNCGTRVALASAAQSGPAALAAAQAEGRHVRVAAAQRVGVNHGRPHALLLQQFRRDDALAGTVNAANPAQLDAVTRTLHGRPLRETGIQSETGDTLTATLLVVGPLGGLLGRFGVGLRDLAGSIGDALTGQLADRAASSLAARVQTVLTRLQELAPTINTAAKGGSALADASASALRAADNPASIFIKSKHLASSGIRGGKFATDDVAEAQGLVAEALRSEGAMFLPNQLDGTFRVVADLGRALGTRGETRIRAIVTDDGRVINAFPVRNR
jgi:RHS repeat-associated protein